MDCLVSYAIYSSTDTLSALPQRSSCWLTVVKREVLDDKVGCEESRAGRAIRNPGGLRWHLGGGTSLEELWRLGIETN